MSEQEQPGTSNLGKERTLERLAAQGVEHGVVEHPAVWTMKDVEALDLPHSGADAKNLLVRDDKKLGYYLLTVRGDKHVDLEAFRKAHGLRRLSLASPAALVALLRADGAEVEVVTIWATPAAATGRVARSGP